MLLRAPNIKGREDTVFLRFVAIILITNSHLDLIYPISALATGGALGNAIFFMLSGYGLALSQHASPRPFGQWYMRRISRIYPSAIIVVVVFHYLLKSGWSNWHLMDYFSKLVWPTPFWFVSALMVFYIVFFIAAKTKNTNIYIILLAISLVPYSYYYATSLDLTQYSIEGPGYFKWIFYFQSMMLGSYLATTRHHKVPAKAKHLGLLSALLLAYYSILLAMHFEYLLKFQFLVHILTLPILYISLLLAGSDFIVKKIMHLRYIAFIIAFIAGLTLQIYLLQSNFNSHAFILSLPFPINLLAFTVVLLFAAYAVEYAARGLRPVQYWKGLFQRQR